MTAKEYLNQAYTIDKQIAGKIRKAEMLRKSLYGKGLNYERNGSNPNHSGDARGRAVAKVVDYENEANQMIDSLIALRIEIENTIQGVPDEKERTLLEKRYLFFESWEKIAVDMDYSVQHIYRIHARALVTVEKMRVNATK